MTDLERLGKHVGETHRLDVSSPFSAWWHLEALPAARATRAFILESLRTRGTPPPPLTTSNS